MYYVVKVIVSKSQFFSNLLSISPRAKAKEKTKSDT